MSNTLVEIVILAGERGAGPVSHKDGQFRDTMASPIRRELVAKLAAMLRLERSAPFELLGALVRARDTWITANIPEPMRAAVWHEAMQRVR